MTSKIKTTAQNSIDHELLHEVLSNTPFETSIEKIKENFTEAEENVNLAAKMKTLYNISSGLAHELNQPIHMILGFTDVLTSNLDDPNPMSEQEQKECLHNIKKAGEKARDLIANYLNFVKKSSESIAPYSIENTLTNVLQLTHNSLKKKIKLTTDRPDEMTFLEGNKDQVLQALIILILQRIKQVEEEHPTTGGEIHISSGLKNDIYQITIEDNGKLGDFENLSQFCTNYFTLGESEKSFTERILKAHKINFDVGQTTADTTKTTLNFPLKTN